MAVAPHPTIDELQAFLAQRPSARSSDATARVVRHLLTGCESCRECLRVLAGGPLPGAGGATRRESAVDYDRVFERVDSAFSVFLADGVPGDQPPGKLLAELVPHLPGKSSREKERTGTSLLVRWLVQRSHAARFEDPDEMLHWARMAHVAADACSEAALGDRARLADLQSRAWAQFGSALRVKGRLVEAVEAQASAWGFFAEGTGDLELKLYLLSRTTSLARDKGDLDAAILQAGEAEKISLDLGDPDQLTKALIVRAAALVDAQEVDAAHENLDQACRSCARGNDPSLPFVTLFDLAVCFHRMERPDLVLPAYLQAKHSKPRSRSTLLDLRTWSAEGRLLRNLGHLDLAERAFLHGRTGFLEKGIAYPAIEASKDLALLYTRQKRWDKFDWIVTETVQTYEGQSLPPSAQDCLEELRGMALA